MQNEYFMMKKLVFGSILAFGLVANAQADDLPKLDVDCDSLNLTLSNSINTGLEVGAYWKKPAIFPNPPIENSTRKYKKPFIIECPNLAISDDGNMVEIKAKDYKTLINFIPSFSRDFDLYRISGYKYPNIKEGFWSSGYSLNLETFKLKSSIYDLKEGMDLSKSLILGVPSQTVLAYKIDGAELKPLIYDKKVSKYKLDFKNANIIDIYQKLDKPVIVERLTIDKANGMIRMYRKSPFPSE